MLPHSSDDDLRLYISGHLLAADSSVIQAHLDGCKECQLRLADIAIQTRWKGPERRSDPRIPVNLEGRLKLLDPVTSIGPPHPVKVLEISRNGLRIVTPRYLIPKTLVQIRFSGRTALGEVRFCLKAESEFQAGLKLVKDFPSA
jgi:hypothetical protein